MKKIIFVTALLFACGVSGYAQENTVEETTAEDAYESTSLIISAGVASNTSPEINQNLKFSGLPQLNTTSFLLGIGYNVTSEKVLMDFEWETAYMNEKKTETDRVRTISTGAVLRIHYIPLRWKDKLVSGGLDLGYMYNQADIYSRGRVIDFNNLNPSAYTGHLSLYNNMFYVGPSASFGVWQGKGSGMRIVTGYRWGFGGKWKSEFAAINNTVKENGTGQFYAKIIINLGSLHFGS
ncbi:hypothetical protein [Flavobacterium rhizosphaerae]|uniref:Outer membrane protein beta-barrel domain-containing protein n=1 Tax=Flavobacterium rhizosphaerae TaxID=3163298 RepID=A0ABW8YX57_9FLAO